MNAAAIATPDAGATSRKADFPGLAGNWAYLDTAATAQKPQVVIDAIARAYGAGLRHRAPRRLRTLRHHDDAF